jgi:hypothetical protein
VPQDQIMGHIYDGQEWNLNLDEEYIRLTGKNSAEDFIRGGRRIIVSNWVENLKGGLAIRICEPANLNSANDNMMKNYSNINVFPVPAKNILNISGINYTDDVKIIGIGGKVFYE